MNAKYTLLTKKKNDSVLMRDKQVYGSLTFSDDDDPRDPLIGLSKHSGLINKKKKIHERQRDDGIELKAVRARTGESGERMFSDETVLLVRDILPSDSLQSFALLYGCTVNDIKRANGLISERDFYALPKIKIPVKRHGLLTDPEEEYKKRHQASCTHLKSSAESSPISESNNSDHLSNGAGKALTNINLHCADIVQSSEFDSMESLESVSNGPAETKVSKEIATEQNDTSTYLKKLDKAIRKTVKKADLVPDFPKHNECLEEVVSSLSSVQYYPLHPPAFKKSPVEKEKCNTNGADCGIKWWSVVLIFFLILIVIGILAVYEYKTK